jgi:cell division transport system permease protein
MRASGAPLLPKEDAREAALFFVVCALCFLAALSGLVARAAYSAADSWTDQVTGQITIRVRGDDAATARTLEIVQVTPGIVSARALGRSESEELLRPWLGATGLPSDLPLPHLVAVEAAPGAAGPGGVGERLTASLKTAGVNAIVDDHVVWSSDVKRATDSAGLIALVAVGLLGATGLAVIAFATHATLLARRDIVELLHLTGAKDSFISGLFEQRFLMLGVQAGALGALLAFGAAAFILFLAKQGDQQIWLLPQLSLSLADGLILGLSPLIAGFAAMLAAKVTVSRSLSDMV